MKTWLLFALVLTASLGFAQGSFPPEPTSLQHVIVSKERDELNCLKQTDVQCFSDLIAENALFVDAHGVANKQQVIAQVSGLKLTDFTISDVHYIPLADRSGLIAYTLTEKGSANSKDFSAKVFVSAIWTERDGKWQCVFSQETPSRGSAGM
jgi:hypothetical protein